MTISVKNRNGSIVFRIDQRIITSLITLGLALFYKGGPL